MTDNESSVQVGAYVLESLTTGMYSTDLDALREYIQNAFDSIQLAIRSKVIDRKAGRINVVVSKKKRLLQVRDNGTGICATKVRSKLVNVGMSDKSMATDAGFRGIGRLAGIAYCDTLQFKTQFNEEKITSTITIDAKRVRDAISPHNRTRHLLKDVLNDCVNVESEPARSDEHYFEVSMIGLTEEGMVFTKGEELRAYLQQVAPLAIDRQSFQLSEGFYSWIGKQKINLSEAQVILEVDGNSYELFKPYKKLTYTTAKQKDKIHLKSLRFFPEDAGPDSPFWLWHAETNCPGTVGDELVAGFRVRKRNISIGFSEIMTDIFGKSQPTNGRFNKYFIGEVHIQDPNVIPNARRDNFEATPEWMSIRAELSQYANELVKEVRNLSQGRNADTERIIQSSESQITKSEQIVETGISTIEEQQKLIDNLDKTREKIQTALKGDREEDERHLLQEQITKIETLANNIKERPVYTTDRLVPSLNRKERKIIQEIIKILYGTLEDKVFQQAKHAILSKFGIDPKG